MWNKEIIVSTIIHKPLQEIPLEHPNMYSPAAKMAIFRHEQQMPENAKNWAFFPFQC